MYLRVSEADVLACLDVVHFAAVHIANYCVSFTYQNENRAIMFPLKQKIQLYLRTVGIGESAWVQFQISFFQDMSWNAVRA